MTLHKMLDSTLFYGQVLIYARNAYDQCVKLFQGSVANARKDENVWDYLTYEVDQWICGNHWTLIYVKHYAYEDKLETCYCNSDRWTRENRPYKSSYQVEKELKCLRESNGAWKVGFFLKVKDLCGLILLRTPKKQRKS